jgi:hypothetical protein
VRGEVFYAALTRVSKQKAIIMREKFADGEQKEAYESSEIEIGFVHEIERKNFRDSAVLFRKIFSSASQLIF